MGNGVDWRGRKRVVLLVEQQEYGGVTVKDCRDMSGEELLKVKGELGRERLRDLRARGVLKGAGKGSGRPGTVRAKQVA